MKGLIKLTLVLLAITTWSCGNKPQDRAGAPVEEESANAVLEREIDKIHMDAMEKMEDIYVLQQKLKKALTDSVMNEEGKKKVEESLTVLDSADQMMRVWMREFRPLNDSIDGEEKAREYLENEMVKVKKLDAEMTEAISKARN